MQSLLRSNTHRKGLPGEKVALIGELENNNSEAEQFPAEHSIAPDLNFSATGSLFKKDVPVVAIRQKGIHVLQLGHGDCPEASDENCVARIQTIKSSSHIVTHVCHQVMLLLF